MRGTDAVVGMCSKRLGPGAGRLECGANACRYWEEEFDRRWVGTKEARCTRGVVQTRSLEISRPVEVRSAIIIEELIPGSAERSNTPAVTASRRARVECDDRLLCQGRRVDDDCDRREAVGSVHRVRTLVLGQ